MSDEAGILVLDRRISREELARLVGAYFEDMGPSQGNRAMEIEDPEVRACVRRITAELIGQGEAL